MHKWKWFGHAAHLIVGNMCRFHLATLVRTGRILVSTVGEYVPRSQPNGIEKFETVGCDRLYETYVFRTTKGKCECGCGLPLINYSEIDSLPANDARTATKNHMKLCQKWASLNIPLRGRQKR